MAELTRLPGPNADLWDWQMQAACRDVGDEDFFHSENERGARKRERDDRAKAVCATCPVVDACREHALKVREPYGVWGGLSVEERHDVLVARRQVAELPAAS